MKKSLVLCSALLPVLALAACNRENAGRATVTAVEAADEADADDIHSHPATMGSRMGMGGHGSMGTKQAPVKVEVGSIKKADGGQTIAEVFAGKAGLKDKKVTVRGKVVKYNTQILGKNWLHIQDGTGDAAAKTHDLTVTTTGDAKVGDTVLVTGDLHLDKDFTAGYKYDVIIEDAKVVVE